MSKLNILITSGPTKERIDPVRYISNDSSGKQGYAIAGALAARGHDVKVVSGAVEVGVPDNVKVEKIESAVEMLDACEKNLPADVVICVAAVSDWRVKEPAQHKMKKRGDVDELTLKLVKNPDILAKISSHEKRPKLVVGFAAETQNLIQNAREKLKNKKCDWILANNVSEDTVFGADDNKVSLIDSNDVDEWGKMSKDLVAQKLADRIEQYFCASM